MNLELLYQDDSITVINKPEGMLSIPGRGPERIESVSGDIRKLFADCIEQPSVHRLDMDTSGLMVLALTKTAHRNLSIQFQNGEIHKKYIALLDGKIDGGLGNHGRIELKFRLDINNRPHQIFDPVQGKTGVTIWKKLGELYGKTRVEFIPLTGRTHQLRLHSAHPYKPDGSGGLGCPICGDRLYGKSNDEEHARGVRMLLHASEIEFRHPLSGKIMKFNSDIPF
jgi:tRNA pseudouridine32 synthase/23S rRNA pseudouridine746 synthase